MGDIIIKKVSGESLLSLKDVIGDFLEGQRGKGGVFKNMSAGYFEDLILTEDDAISFLAYEGDELVGNTSVFTRYHESSSGVLKSACVAAVAVKANMQGRGIGRKMMTAVNEFIQKEDYAIGILFTDDIGFFGRALGWKIVPWQYEITKHDKVSSSKLSLKQGLSDGLIDEIKLIYESTTKGNAYFPRRSRKNGNWFLDHLRKVAFKKNNPDNPYYRPFDNDSFFTFYDGEKLIGYAYVADMKTAKGEEILDIREIGSLGEGDYVLSGQTSKTF